jgi:hypothetical protein
VVNGNGLGVKSTRLPHHEAVTIDTAGQQVDPSDTSQTRATWCATTTATTRVVTAPADARNTVGARVRTVGIAHAAHTHTNTQQTHVFILLKHTKSMDSYHHTHVFVMLTQHTHTHTHQKRMYSYCSPGHTKRQTLLGRTCLVPSPSQHRVALGRSAGEGSFITTLSYDSSSISGGFCFELPGTYTCAYT